MNNHNHCPNEIWTIDFNKQENVITVKCNGVPSAWGTFYYEDDLVNTFLSHQLSSKMPKCICGHEFAFHCLGGPETVGRCQYDNFQDSCDCEGYRNE
jgi:hypothetical protein